MLNKFFVNLLLFGICLSAIFYLFDAFGFSPQVQIQGDLSTWQGWFSLSAFDVLFAGGTAAMIGLAAMLLRQGTFAVFGMLLAGLTMIITPIKNFVFAIPNLLSLMLPASTNPNPSLFPVNPIIVVVDLLFAFAAYWFIFGLVVQRDLG